MNYRVYEWYQILEQDIDYVWRPDILFQKVIDTKILPMYGNEEIFQMWFNTKDNHMEHYQAIKVTFACDYDFQHFPFDSHNCDFDFGMGSQVYNKTANFGPVEILNMDSKTELLNFEKEISNDHLPFSFKIVAKDDYGHYNFNYFSPYTGIVINLKREKLGNLFGGFFAPTCIFALLSMISFLIHPEVVRYVYNYINSAKTSIETDTRT